MNLDFSPEENAFRAEVRAFIAQNYPADLRAAQDSGRPLTKDEYLSWHKVLAKKGWVAPSWPVEFGGTGWTPTQKYIWSEESARAERITGDDGKDYYLVNGQKTWTTLAQHADWGFFLVRTDPNAKKQEGISFLLIDMKTPGITVRPLITIDGSHEVNEVFLENVKVPVENRIFDENKGWTAAKFLLAHERSGIAGVARSKRGIERLRGIASSQPADDGEPLLSDPMFKRKVAELEIDLTALEYTELRTLAGEAQGKGPGVESSLLKIKGTEIGQRLTELVLEAAGHYGAPYFRGFPVEGGNALPIGPDFAARAPTTYFNMRKTSIFGGSNEIQRNIIAKMVLGL